MRVWSDISARLRALVEGEDAPALAEEELRRAVAVLLTRALVVDGAETADETARLTALLRSRFELSEA